MLLGVLGVGTGMTQPVGSGMEPCDLIAELSIGGCWRSDGNHQRYCCSRAESIALKYITLDVRMCLGL